MTPNDAGGTRHFELVQFFINQGHDITVIAGDINYLSGKKADDPIKEGRYPGIRIIRVGTSKKLHGGFIGRLMSFIIFMIN